MVISWGSYNGEHWCSTSYYAECSGIIYALNTALDNNWLKVFIVSDSKAAINAFINNKISWELRARREHISSKLQIRFKHSWRECNFSADNAANIAARMSPLTKVCQDDHEEVGESSAVILLPKNFQNSPEYLQEFQFGMPNLAPGEKLSQPVSPFSVRVSNYSSEDENVSGNRQVDDNAKEFIRMFYEQLWLQNRTQLIQYQAIC
ncbi:hypothetical protein GIB67_002773 [Kingdonia uniflora]|uniref:RNase H type-1 domain-containing protein n=1 Tax=Kingdonia uniflora TaxID=39325 RepID=A0A7J7LSX4_9MAGN|nr:hypothetical protein GIB67_002773 [Kingdonia uniflora]